MTSEAARPLSIAAGEMFSGRYRLTERIASGGMGEIWRAEDGVLERDVAVKFLREEFADDELFRERLRREARAAGSISHAGVVPVFDFGEFTRENGSHVAFIVMEYVDGPSLATILKDGPLTPERAAAIIEQTALGLQSAHDAGVVHRDIKPANILLAPNGDVKLTDFGISHAANAMPITRTGVLIGTASYLSPEQAGGQRATKASDIYGLGVVAYACLTGEVPFSEGNDISVALAHLRQRPAELSYDVPEGFRNLVMSMLEKEPDRRPPSAAAVAEVASRTARPDHEDGSSVIASAANDEDTHTRIDLTPLRSGRTVRVKLIGAIAVLVLVAAAVFAWSQTRGVTVPNLIGEQRAVATTRLDGAGLRTKVRTADVAGKKAGVVVKQSVPAETKIDGGSAVLLTIASGKIGVPTTLAGLDYDAAAKLLVKLGLSPRKASAVSTKTVGTVIAVSPGGRVANGATVTLTVAVAAPPVPSTTDTGKGGKGKGKGKKGH